MLNDSAASLFTYSHADRPGASHHVSWLRAGNLGAMTSELSVLCGGQVGIPVQSQARKVHLLELNAQA
eukprot:1161538-Pelagomonas_calceolata.AAC.9